VTRVLLITGGSRGAGAATARLAAARGFAVCINYSHDEQTATTLVREILAAGGNACAYRADAGREEDITSLFSYVDATLGPLTALVHNARAAGPRLRLDQLGAEALQRNLSTAVLGSLLGAREAVRRMSTRQGGPGGAIVLVGAPPSRGGSSTESVDDAATRGAVEAVTVALAKEVAAEGIRVNAVRPALSRPGLNLSGGTANRTDRAVGPMVMETGTYAAEAARTALWLISDDASRTTGAIVDVAHKHEIG
jgi:NAD(P)-dependent dehydrogenase (short-subunit alcohol dehydrogenase family)